MPSPTIIRIATRKSPLAIWQAEYVKAELQKRHPGMALELVGLSTRGDRILDAPLAKIGGKGLFLKELEDALLDGRADLAVHSMKDVPMELPPGLCLAAICAREDPSDAFVANRFVHLDELPAGAIVGTSSLRRQCQIRERYPQLQIRDLRGNVNTRLGKLDNGEFDAIILATAGLLRLQMVERIRSRLPPTLLLPAGGQGAVGIECRSDDNPLIALLQDLHDRDTATCVSAERALNRRLNGGCQVPIACYGELAGDRLRLRGLVGSPDGSEILRDEEVGAREQAEAIGTGLAERLLVRGAGRILADVYGS